MQKILVRFLFSIMYLIFREDNEGFFTMVSCAIKMIHVTLSPGKLVAQQPHRITTKFVPTMTITMTMTMAMTKTMMMAMILMIRWVASRR